MHTGQSILEALQPADQQPADPQPSPSQPGPSQKYTLNMTILNIMNFIVQYTEPLVIRAHILHSHYLHNMGDILTYLPQMTAIFFPIYRVHIVYHNETHICMYIFLQGMHNNQELKKINSIFSPY